MKISTSLIALVAMTSSPALAQEQAPQPAAALPAAEAVQRPNVLIWMMDDVGFAQLSSYGGLVQTPNIDRVARQGVRYANYRTPPI